MKSVTLLMCCPALHHASPPDHKNEERIQLRSSMCSRGLRDSLYTSICYIPLLVYQKVYWQRHVHCLSNSWNCRCQVVCAATSVFEVPKCSALCAFTGQCTCFTWSTRTRSLVFVLLLAAGILSLQHIKTQ